MSKQTHPDNNAELMELLASRPELNNQRMRLLIEITGYKQAYVCSWFAPPEKDGKPNPSFRAMPAMALDLFKLQCGFAEPAFKEGLPPVAA